MTKFDKAKERLKSKPMDYRYREAKALMLRLGFIEDNKGKTSGSRVKFVRVRDGAVFTMHKPHPSDIMREDSVSDLKDFPEGIGEL